MQGELASTATITRWSSAVGLRELAGGGRGAADEGAVDRAAALSDRVAMTAPVAALEAALTFRPVMLIVSTFALSKSASR